MAGAPPLPAPPLAVVLADAQPGTHLDGMVALVERLHAHLGEPPLVVCWESGPGVETLAATAPVIDAGEVNRAAAPLLLQRLHARPLARRAKSVLLRRALRPLHGAPRLLLDGVATAVSLAWLPPGPRHVDLLLRAHDAVADAAAVQDRIDRFLVSDDRTASALIDAGVGRERIAFVGDPLVTTAAAPPSPRAPVAVAGTRIDLDAVLEVLLVLDRAGLGDGCGMAWVHESPDPGWARWADVRFSGVEDRVVDLTADEVGPGLPGVQLLLVDGDLPGDLGRHAAAAGVPVVERDEAGTWVETLSARVGADEDLGRVDGRDRDAAGDGEDGAGDDERGRVRERHDVGHAAAVVLGVAATPAT